jgi:hypothetical protein
MAKKARDESATCTDQLAADGDHDGASTWTAAVALLANNTLPPTAALIGRHP